MFKLRRAVNPCLWGRPVALFALWAAGFLLVGVQSASAGSVTLNAVDSGNVTFLHWSDGDLSVFHSPSEQNYGVGYSRPYSSFSYRNFFVFDLSGVIQTVIGAELRVFNPSDGYLSNDPSETYTLWDVSTPVSELVAGGSDLFSAYDDLGSGTSYGSRVVTSADNGTLVTVSLNADALAALNSASGSFALGGSLTTINSSGTQLLFRGTNPAGGEIRQLVLTTSDVQPVPTPAAIGTGVIGFALLALRRGRRGNAA